MEKKYFLYKPTNLIGEFKDKKTFAEFIIDNHKDMIDPVIREKAWIDHYVDYSMNEEKSYTYYPYLVEEVCKMIELTDENYVNYLKDLENKNTLANKMKPLEERLKDLFIREKEYDKLLKELNEEGL